MLGWRGVNCEWPEFSLISTQSNIPENARHPHACVDLQTRMSGYHQIQVCVEAELMQSQIIICYLLAPISPGISGPTVFLTEAVWIVSFSYLFLSKIFYPHPCIFCISQPNSCNCLTFDSSPIYFVFQHFFSLFFFCFLFSMSFLFRTLAVKIWLQSAELVIVCLTMFQLPRKDIWAALLQTYIHLKDCC